MGQWWRAMRVGRLSGAWMRWHRRPDPPYLAEGGGEVAADAQLWHPSRQGLRPKRTAVVTHYTQPPEGSTTICTYELGPVVPRTFPPAPGWSPNGQRIK